MKKKSIIRRLLPWIIFLAAIAALVLFVFVPIYSRTKSDYGRETEIYFFAGDGKPLTMETDQLLFEMDGETSLFKVTNKNTGKVWYSNPEGRENDTHAQSQDLKAFLSCTLDLSYYSDISMETMNNFTGSIKNQSFVITQEEDNGSIRVDYSIGKNAGKKYLVPNVITKERFDAFLGNMKKGPKNRVKGIYTAVDPKKLGSQANKDEILATYPIAAEQAVYIMKSDTNATQKEEAEEAFVAAGYTEEDYETDQQLMVGEKETAGPVFNVSVIYSLEGPDLVVRIPYDEIRCRAEYPVVYVSPLPMFGAAGKTQEGFSLIPEGGGAILKFNNGKLNQEAYFANNYGWDYGRTREKEEVVSETEIAFPVFGMSHEDGSFICIMEGADAYGGIAADISGRLNDFNTVYGKYNVIHYDTVKVDAKKSAKKMLMYEDAIPNDTLIQRYRILDDNTYVSMAHAYGDYL